MELLENFIQGESILKPSGQHNSGAVLANSTFHMQLVFPYAEETKHQSQTTHMIPPFSAIITVIFNCRIVGSLPELEIAF